MLIYNAGPRTWPSGSTGSTYRPNRDGPVHDVQHEQDPAQHLPIRDPLPPRIPRITRRWLRQQRFDALHNPSGTIHGACSPRLTTRIVDQHLCETEDTRVYPMIGFGALPVVVIREGCGVAVLTTAPTGVARITVFPGGPGLMTRFGLPSSHPGRRS
jgi:hypothetical protein